MLTETALDILRYFSRTELEGLQMHSRFLRDIVDRNATKLALRFICEVNAHDKGGAWLQLKRDSSDEDSLFKVLSLTQSSLGLLLDRVNNAFVERLNISLLRHDDDPDRDSDGARFLGYLRDNAGALECRIKTLCDTGLINSQHHIDFALADFVANHLRPQALHIIVCGEELQASHARLFDQMSMRSSLKHVLFEEDYMPTISVIPGLLNVDTLQSCDVCTSVDPAPWIVHFANTFKTTNAGVKVVQNVTIIRSRHGIDATADLSLLGTTTRQNIRAPHSDFVARYFRRSKGPVKSAADLFVFANTGLGKRLHIYKWTAEETVDYGMHDTSEHSPIRPLPPANS